MQVSTIWCHLDQQHALERPRMAIRVPGEFHEASSRMLLAHCSSPQRLTVAFLSLEMTTLEFRHSIYPNVQVTAFHHNMTFPAQNAKRHPPKKMSLCADGETRTHTGQRPLPPQSSVSTISPRPQYFGTAKLRTKIKKQNFFEIFLCIFVELFRKTAKLRRQFIGTHCVTV